MTNNIVWAAGLTAAMLVAGPVGTADAADSASTPACINAHVAYNARPVGRHVVKVWRALGDNRTPLTLTTSCLDLDPNSGVGVETAGVCIAQGDRIAARTRGGRPQSCRVLSVAPFEADDVERGYQ